MYFGLNIKTPSILFIFLEMACRDMSVLLLVISKLPAIFDGAPSKETNLLFRIIRSPPT